MGVCDKVTRGAGSGAFCKNPSLDLTSDIFPPLPALLHVPSPTSSGVCDYSYQRWQTLSAANWQTTEPPESK